MKTGSTRNLLLALVVLGSGIANLYSLISPEIPERAVLLREIFPLVFIHLSRFFSLLTGFALITLSINIYKRKRRAFRLALLLSIASVFFYLIKGLDYEEAGLSILLVVLLWLSRKSFTVESSIPSLGGGLVRLGIGLGIALVYGVLGFWLLDTREFGISFTIGDSIHRTLRFLYLAGDPEIVPRTPYAHWFLDSLYVITMTAMAYALFSIFRPAVYRFRTLPHERELAEEITARYGRSSLDFFKYWPDKTFFFSESRQSYIGFRVVAGHAVALGDPVGPDEEIEAVLRKFVEFCTSNDWRTVFYQTLPDFLPVYKELGFRKLKIGDDAIVDLSSFSVEGKGARRLRQRVSQLDRQGYTFKRYDPPVSADVLAQLKRVSDGWLQIPGRRERTFTLGRFDPDYIRATPVYAAADPANRILAFVNGIPSFSKGEATVDLMRHIPDAPQGMMDYLFVKLFQAKRDEGYRRFNLGMAPMAGFSEHEEASAEERAVHYFISQLSFIFSFQGISHYKAKFATAWEPRYLIYRNVLGLPRVARVISEVGEMSDG